MYNIYIAIDTLRYCYASVSGKQSFRKDTILIFNYFRIQNQSLSIKLISCCCQVPTPVKSDFHKKVLSDVTNCQTSDIKHSSYHMYICWGYWINLIICILLQFTNIVSRISYHFKTHCESSYRSLSPEILINFAIYQNKSV